MKTLDGLWEQPKYIKMNTTHSWEVIFDKDYLDSTYRDQKSVIHIAMLSNNNPRVMC